MGKSTVKEVLIKAGKGKAKGTGKGSKKYGRNLLKCGKYKSMGKREKNKKRNIAKDLKMKAKKRLKKVGEALL